MKAPMTLSIYDISVPVLKRGLTNLSAHLKKAEASAEDRKIDPSVFLAARLAPDMHPLSRQVQIASDGAKGGVARLTATDAPSFPDTETTFAELHERIAKTVAYLDTLKPEQFDGAQTREIVLKTPMGDFPFTGQSFALTFMLPNFFFHLTTAYNILRHNGVSIGKMDFIGGA